MATTLRTFIAVPISATPPLRKLISQLADLGRAVKPVNPDRLHVTLKFLGDTAAEQVAEVAAAVRESVAGQEAFDILLQRTGVFPHARRPTVVWAGIEGGEPLVRIANDLEQRLERLGFPRENRAYQPHLTLARIRRRPPEELATLLERESESAFGAVAIESVVYYQSDLQSGGPVYTPLETIGFG